MSVARFGNTGFALRDIAKKIRRGTVIPFAIGNGWRATPSATDIHFLTPLFWVLGFSIFGLREVISDVSPPRKPRDTSQPHETQNENVTQDWEQAPD